jgi:hypothetical protein
MCGTSFRDKFFFKFPARRRLKHPVLVLLSLTIAVLLAPFGGNRAKADVEIVCSGPLPFSRAELEGALRARRPLLGVLSSVEVRAEDSGRSLVRVGTAERELDWNGRTGEEAARLVAVLVLDLARADAPMIVRSPAASASSGGASRPIRVGLTLESPFDQDGVDAHLQPTLDLAVDMTSGVAAFVTAGYRRVAAATSAGALDMDEFPLRAGLAYGRRWLELRLCALARPYTVGGAGTHRGTIWGGGVAAAMRWPVRRRLAVVLAAGLDVSRSRVLFSIDQQPVLSTAWIAPWLGAGLAWESAL